MFKIAIVPFSITAGQQPLLQQTGLSIDPHYSAHYGNPYLIRTSNSSLPPLPPPSTANPAATPAPPPYNANRNPPPPLGNSNSSSLLMMQQQQLQQQQQQQQHQQPVSSPSGQFIVPGNLKKGALATHV